MRAPPGDAGGFGASGPSVSADEQGRAEANDRGVRATTNWHPASWAWPRIGRFERDRPPRWFSSPLILVAVLAGCVAFSTAWGLLGEAAVAISVATIVGVGAGSGTVVAGSLVWIRLSDQPATPGY